MLIIKFSGGLGNQMFQYALLQKLKHLDNTMKVDLGSYASSEERNFELNFFHPKLMEANSQEIAELADEKKDLFSRIRRKLFGKKATYYKECDEVAFEPKVLELKHAYLEGYWQSEKYFKDIRQQIVESFRFPEIQNDENNNILYHIRNSLSVSVHIRRGDYLDASPFYRYGNICTEEYYLDAMEYMEKLLGKEIQYFVFSDDMDWVKKRLTIKNSVYVDWNHGADSIYDMFLMSQCKHNIIANSSFSWWGAWLNDYNDKIVAAPYKWFNNHVAPDIICESWVKIPRRSDS